MSLVKIKIIEKKFCNNLNESIFASSQTKREYFVFNKQFKKQCVKVYALMPYSEDDQTFNKLKTNKLRNDIKYKFSGLLRRKDDPDMKNKSDALFLATFVLGIGTGVWFGTNAASNLDNFASTYTIDARTPNTEVCMSNGFSSIVLDQRLFISFNPFNVFVSQPEMKPGCVLNRANVYLLEDKKLVSSDQVQQCKRRMNTFAFVGDINDKPEVTCVYHSENAKNAFIKKDETRLMGSTY